MWELFNKLINNTTFLTILSGVLVFVLSQWYKESIINPEKQYKETMANMDPAVQCQVVYQMAHEDKKILEVFDTSAYTPMMQRQQKPDMVKSMIGLSYESLQGMISELPKDLFAIVATQVDTKELAKFLISDCQNVIEKLGTRF